jgi:hypothetical protein
MQRRGYQSINKRQRRIFVHKANCCYRWLLRKPDAIEARISRLARSKLNREVNVPISLPIGLPRD